MSDAIHVDIAIIGAGIAGAGVAAGLAGDANVVLLEQEIRPGHHSTGRSAAIFIQNYGNAVIRALSQASMPLFAPHILSPRGILFVTDETGLESHRELLATAEGLNEISAEAAAEMVPLLRRAWIAAAAYEEDAKDIDVNALHQGWLRQGRDAGARLVVDAPVIKGRHNGGRWHLETPAGDVTAKIIVNAAGGWADIVAQACGVAPVGLVPKRRSMAVLPCPHGLDCRHWPLISETADQWYCKPEPGRLLVSPADEDPVAPHDVFADDMVLAEGLNRYEQAVRFPVTHVLGNWAGLRTFAPDNSPVAGFDVSAPDGFFWLAGQGGYGIQTAPALSDLAARLVKGDAPQPGLQATADAMSPARFR